MVRLLELTDTRYYGRQELVDRLKIGEGSVRTITALLRSKGLVEIRRAGTRLTLEGRRLVESLRSQFSKGVPVPAGEAAVDTFSVAIAVRGGAVRVSSGVEQRDAAIMAGATGASTFVHTSGKLSFPGMYSDLSAFDPELSTTIIGELRPSEGDAVVVGSAADLDTAFIGAIAAATSLL
jgi:hypothetical protein